MALADRLIGAELLGYRIEALAGRGGMGVVYRAYDPRLKRKVALKLIAPELSEGAQFRGRFLAETELAASLEHPNVVPIHDAGEVDGQLYLVMRYVDGCELKTLLQREGPLEPARAVAICGEIGAALDAAHARGLVHRDVKPSNVLLDEDEHVYLADFGLSRRLADTGRTADAGLSVGTPAYAAPEQIEGRDVDGRADVYSLGCVLYECLTGHVPYPRDSELAVLWAHLQDAPPKARGHAELDRVFATALAKDPDNRYASCSEIVEAAGDALGLHRPARDRKTLILTAVGVAIAAAAVLAGILLSTGGGRARPSTKPTLTPKVDSVQRIDPKTNKLVATIGGIGSNPDAIAVGAGGVWVGSQEDGTVSRVDARTNAVRGSVQTGGPVAIAVRDGSVLVGNQGYGMTTIDPATMDVSPSQSPYYTSFAQGGGALWALVGPLGTRLDRINHGLQIVKTFTTLGTDPFAVTADDHGVWVLDDVSRTLFRVDPATDRVVGRIPLGFDPGWVAVGGGSVWVTDAGGGAVVRIDPRSDRVVGRIRVGRDPQGVVVAYGAAWVANYEDGTVSRIDLRSGAVTTIPVGRYPATLATGGAGVWVPVRGA